MENDEKRDKVVAAKKALGKAREAEDVAAVWKQYYLIIGHRVLGRLLIGQPVEQAMRIKKEK